MNLKELEAKVKAENLNESKTLTLADLAGKSAVLPLPAGLHEVKIVDITSTSTSKSFRMVVEATNKQQYAVNLNIGNNAEQAGIFLSIISHLLDQIGLKTLDLEAMKKKVGSEICVMGIERSTDRGTFVNYTFNPAVMASALKD